MTAAMIVAVALLLVVPIHAVPTMQSPLLVKEVPEYVRPYAIRAYDGKAVALGNQVYRFPVTGPSSGGAFSLIGTAAPASGDLGVLPHIHQAHYENFFCMKGRFQLWTEKDGDQEARLLTPGDYGAVPHNTTHTFQLLDPFTELVGVIQPGGFENLFYFLANSNYPSYTNAPFAPANTTNAAGAGSDPSLLQKLESLDVYAELNFITRRDLVNGSAPTNTTWHTGPDALALDAFTPFFVAKDYGPKYLNTGVGYQIIQPFQTPATSDGNFTQGTITIDRLLPNVTVPKSRYSGCMAFDVIEGQLTVNIDAETVDLIEGDVVFIPSNTSSTYWSKVSFTQFLYVGQGVETLDQALIDKSEPWDYPVWPTFAGLRVQ